MFHTWRNGRDLLVSYTRFDNTYQGRTQKISKGVGSKKKTLSRTQERIQKIFGGRG